MKETLGSDIHRRRKITKLVYGQLGERDDELLDGSFLHV